MFIYLTLASIGLISFGLYFYLALKRSTFFGLNRWYLSCTLVFCLIVPLSYNLIEIDAHLLYAQEDVSVYASQVVQGVLTVSNNLRQFDSAAPDYIDWLFWCYFSISGLLFIRLVWSLASIRNMTSDAVPLRTYGHRVFHSKKIKEPLAIFRSIYLPTSMADSLPQQILIHENEHVKKWHSVDLFIVEMALILLWFNPFIYLYKSSIRINLEYLADREVLKQQGDMLGYQSLLLDRALNRQQYSFPITTNFTTPLKNRIEMMKKKNSNRWLWLTALGALPIAVILVGMNTRHELAEPITDTILPYIEQMQPSVTPSGWPIDESDLIKATVGFGTKMHPILRVEKLHTGIDIVARLSTPIYATADGEVALATRSNDRGNYLEIKHSDMYKTQYAHLNNYIVKAGEVVKKGQLIGYVGNSGMSTGPHLHYEVHKDGKPVDPKGFIDGC